PKPGLSITSIALVIMMKKILTMAPHVMMTVAMLLWLRGAHGAAPGNWKIVYDKSGKTLHLTRAAGNVDLRLHASYKWNGRLITTKDYAGGAVTVQPLNDAFGKGSLLQVTYRDEKLPTLVQSFYQYPGRDYLLTDFTLEARSG